MTEHTAKGADRRYRIGSITFGRYGWRRWEANRRGRGVDGKRTPLGAFLALRRWEKVRLSPIPPEDGTNWPDSRDE